MRSYAGAARLVYADAPREPPEPGASVARASPGRGRPVQVLQTGRVPPQAPCATGRSDTVRTPSRRYRGPCAVGTHTARDVRRWDDPRHSAVQLRYGPQAFSVGAGRVGEPGDDAAHNLETSDGQGPPSPAYLEPQYRAHRVGHDHRAVGRDVPRTRLPDVPEIAWRSSCDLAARRGLVVSLRQDGRTEPDDCRQRIQTPQERVLGLRVRRRRDHDVRSARAVSLDPGYRACAQHLGLDLGYSKNSGRLKGRLTQPTDRQGPLVGSGPEHGRRQ